MVNYFNKSKLTSINFGQTCIFLNKICNFFDTVRQKIIIDALFSLFWQNNDSVQFEASLNQQQHLGKCFFPNITFGSFDVIRYH